MKMDYEKSAELAISLGYNEIIDENAYKGRFFQKDQKIWIHDIEALKRKLGVVSNEELIDLSYDVENYHKYKNHTNEMVDNEMKHLYEALSDCDGEATYLSDGMWLFPDGSIHEK